MKNWIKGVGFVVMAAGLLVTGCHTKPHVDSDGTMFDYMQKESAKIAEKGGMASVGLGESRNTQLAISKAKVEARKNLAQLVQIKLDNLEKAFKEEIGAGSGSELNALFSSTTKQLTTQTLQGTVPKMQKYEINDGITTAYVLMVLDPEVISDSLKNNAAKHLYERFRSTQAFDELDREVKAYKAAEVEAMKALK